MNRLLRYILQAFNYALFMGMVWYFSIMPPYHQLQENEAVVTLTLAHAAKLKEACRIRTPEELAKLAPNMRLAKDCPRERSPIALEIILDGELIAQVEAHPPGLYKDQGVDIFRQIRVPAGDYTLLVTLNDDVNTDGPTFEHEQEISLVPEQQLLIDFNATNGGFFID